MGLVLGVDASNTGKNSPLPVILVMDEATDEVDEEFGRKLPTPHNSVKTDKRVRELSNYIRGNSQVTDFYLTPRDVNGSSVREAQERQIVQFVKERPRRHNRIYIDSMHPRTKMGEGFTSSVRKASKKAKVFYESRSDVKYGTVKAAHWYAHYLLREMRKDLKDIGMMGKFSDKKFVGRIRKYDPEQLIGAGLCLWPEEFKELYE